MPKISVIIAAYNVEPYIGACLDSVRAQTLQDIEIIVVDDASTDGTAALLAEAARADDRITVITHERNQGLHLTRKTGVEAATGRYAFFLDGDDDLAPTMCEELYANLAGSPVDILHFGLTVIGENGILDEECKAFERFNNTPTPDAQYEDIVRNIFLESRGFAVDWRVTQRAFRTSLLKRAFAMMTGDRLERAEDGYECLVASAIATSYRSAKQCRGYRYHYGRGVTGTNQITADTFRRFCEQFGACFDAADEFASAQPQFRLNDCAAGFRTKAIELLSNDWRVRVPEDGKAQAAQAMGRVFGNVVAAREIWRHVRDVAWTLCTAKTKDPRDVARMNDWAEIARSLEPDGGSRDDLRRFAKVHDRAEELIADLDRARELEEYDRQRIRIFVTTHKNVDKPKSAILQPVQVGLKPGSYRFPWAFHDDDGENISDRNPRYCELTTQYWAWKNVDADYYGFCHYRRYFDFSDTEHEENPYGEIMDDYIDAKAVREYGLDDETIARAVDGWDVITTRWQNLEELIDKRGTPQALWEAAPALVDDDLARCIHILCDMHPEYREDADTFLNGNRACFCNMFIMRKAIFQDYCAWLFPILDRFERETDMTDYSREAARTPGHLSERLLNIYLMHHQRTGANWKMKQTQCVHFTHPDPEDTLKPLWGPESGLPQPVPVVFAADNNYVSQLGTTIYSMMSNASKERFYDVVVLQKDIEWERQERLRQFFSARFGNMSLRFKNVEREVAGYDLTTSNAHISVETYYRFLIQELLPFYDKVLYLDSDIVINGDVSELYDTELGDHLLAAVHDIDYLGNLNMPDGIRMKYSKDTLRMRNPYDYFQAGVLVLNTKAMRERYTITQWLGYASDPDLIYNDQDVLNMHCEGDVLYLPWEWNVVHNLEYRVERIFSCAPSAMFDGYLASRSNPKIIHYAGYIKPWTDPSCDFASIYWRYARQTPFYEQLLAKVSQKAANEAATQMERRAADEATERVMSILHPKHERAVGEDNPIRNIIDPLMPIGSKRRDAVKAIGRMLRGRR
ncbi:DUF4422 domain-containing protein [Bifidobacterium amazonense]|uniref:DUF4422 domain-containing protein n=1 Tax=Bifidobacterium amazonense TaxID=2809027 RepID=A0ABS9VXC8_9BIFI|nr:DUF4422 domain-containing protein [Bifidobacterium amazonense]MCH9276634.1 DUF4422 domain-containing protein [Bifidobacterium amazonense]